MAIHRATAADCRAVAEVHVESWRYTYKDVMPAQFLASLSVDEREEMWRQLVERHPEHLLVARKDDKTLGFVSFGACRDGSAPATTAEIWAIYVKPSSWSTGVGRNLWLAALQQMRRERFLAVTLWVLSNNCRAIEFYKRAGFTPEPGAFKQLDIGGVTLEEQRYVRAVDA